MKKPEYITQINMFYDWCAVHHLPPLAKLLWYMLMQLDNLSGWSEWFEASTTRLTMLLDSSRPTLIKNRQALEDAGLIEYKPGNKGQPGLYKMNFLARDRNGVPMPSKSPASDPYTKAYTQKEPKNDSLSGKSNKENNAAIKDGANKGNVSNDFTQSLTENEIVSRNLTESFTENSDVSNSLTENTSDSEKVSRIVSRIVSRDVSNDLTESFTENNSLLYINNKTETETETETLYTGNAPDASGDIPDNTNSKAEEVDAVERVVQEWKDFRTGGMKRVVTVNEKRRRAIQSKCKVFGLDAVLEAVRRTAEAQGERTFVIDIDGLMRGDGVKRALEGDFDDSLRPPEKKPYGEFGNVWLTDDEVTKAKKKWPGMFDRMVEILGNYKASKGRHYTSDYAALGSWVEKRIKEDMRRNQSHSQNRSVSGDYLWNLSMFDEGTGGKNDEAGNRTDIDNDKNQLPGVSYEVE